MTGFLMKKEYWTYREAGTQGEIGHMTGVLLLQAMKLQKLPTNYQNLEEHGRVTLLLVSEEIQPNQLDFGLVVQ